METGDNLTWDDVEILIVGAGTMGASLAQTYAQIGFHVGVIDISEGILDLAQSTINMELEAALQRGIFSEPQVTAIKQRILFTTSYKQACPGKNLKLAIETATEDIEVKKEIFQTLDELCHPGVIFASNTSSLDTNILAHATTRPDKVVWMHFFYLPHKNRAAEYAGTDSASEESVQAAAMYLKLAGKVATPILSSRKGGAADVIFVALLLEATRMADEGFDVPSIEAAGKAAYNMPVGFLELMDANGIPLGIVTMYSFADATNPDDSLYKIYGDFFSPPEKYKDMVDKYQKAQDKSRVRWVSADVEGKAAEDSALVEELKNRFLAVGFMTASEVVEGGVIDLNEVDKLCQTAFLWKEGPFAIMNRMGWDKVSRIVTKRANLAQTQGIHFPFPEILALQAEKQEPWPLMQKSIIFSKEKKGRVARILISNPKASNALDNQVIEELDTAFQKANQDDTIKVIIFDSAPIKVFITGMHISPLLRNIKQGDFKTIRDDITKWQDILFHRITGKGKAKIAIVDGITSGAGAEVALAFALDPDSLVTITERTSYSFPETGLGLYPRLRGAFTLPQVIYHATRDAETAMALSRYYILTGGAASISPRIIKHLGMADFLIPARDRETVADILAQAIIDNSGNILNSKQLDNLEIAELSSVLNSEEEEELRKIPEIFTKGFRGQTDVIPVGDSLSPTESTIRRIADNSPHAVDVSDELISRGFEDFLKGKTLDELAQWELESYLTPTYQHPDALEGMSAAVERRSPEFKRRDFS